MTKRKITSASRAHFAIAALVLSTLLSLQVGGSRPASAQSTSQELRLSSTMADDLTPILYAIKVGLFKKAGVDVQLSILSSGAAVAAAVAGNAIDIGKSSLVSVMNAHVHGVPIALVAAGGMYNEKAPYAQMVIASDAQLKTAKDLNGKIIGVPAIGDFSTLVTSLWSDKNGGDAKSLKFVEVPGTEQAAAVASHRIDAADLQQPDLEMALQGGKVKYYANVYSAISPSFMFTGWFAKTDWAAAHLELLKTFVRVATDAARYTNTHHAETVDLLADASKIPTSVIQKMSRTDSGLSLSTTLIQPLIDAAAKYKLIPHGFPAAEFIYTAP